MKSCEWYKCRYNEMCSKNCNYLYKLTYCFLCDEVKDFNNCPHIYYSYEEDCSDIKVFYFNETDKFIRICKTQNKFILLEIDHHSYEEINRKIIYINCTSNSEYNGNYSLIYNNSINDYNLITEYNFSDINCFFTKEEEKNDFINTTIKNISHDGLGFKEFEIDNSQLLFNDSDSFLLPSTISCFSASLETLSFIS